MKEQFIYVYQTVCNVNGKTYIGVHRTTKINDGYIGSGIRGYSTVSKNPDLKQNSYFHNAVRKYGYDNFTRHILSFYDTYEEALEEERFIVNIDWVNSNENYNSALGGQGYAFCRKSKDEVSEMYRGNKNHRYGKKAHNIRSVIQYTISGEKIAEYTSISEASAVIGQRGNITACCLGKYAHCGGFVFRYTTYSKEESNTLSHQLSLRQRKYKSDGSWESCNHHLKKKSTAQPQKGRICSEETKKKMYLAKIGKKRFPYNTQKILLKKMEVTNEC